MSQSKTTYEEVKEMLDRGYTVDQINKITGYEEDYIQAVKEDIENGVA